MAMKKFYLFPALLVSLSAFADFSTNTPQSANVLAKQIDLAIYQNDIPQLYILLEKYRSVPDAEKNTILELFAESVLAKAQQDYTTAIRLLREILAQNPALNPVRIELAKVLFLDQQNNEAEMQFKQAKSDHIPPQVEQLINLYLNAIQQRNSWYSYINTYYVQTKNVNNTASSRNIENTGFIKNDDMLPQSAHGIAFNLTIGKDSNLSQSHYLALVNNFSGKYYWDKHDYTDIQNRLSVGYKRKSAAQQFAILPFYEWRWLANKRYQQNSGLSLEWSKWLNNNLQLSANWEYSRNRYPTNQNLNGYNQLFSTTLLWLPNSTQLFYLGTDFQLEKTRVKQYSNRTHSVRTGWKQEWRAGISTQLNLSFSQRKFQDKAVLGGILPLNKVRQDKIYNASLTLWKRDWHYWDITPKLRLTWKKQASNISTMYSYSDKNINLLFEKSF
ncbi:surface lipoprotein assembly modifier [Gallibacterium salpingitidis]|uniref:surface lipoprotein assembly modifier n=1 Tax=Gallibacterium salpingitidis TaxID=505341 RepID=UPI00266F9D15|nr:surface lipoprotein assembly modifier [Gallibacterium salpingitidis]WKS99747.1 surface lipoprotein assembly modifier [Gallibacterium salpingitidis]